MRDRSYSRAISNMNSDSGSEEIVRNGTNRSVFHKKGMSFIELREERNKIATIITMFIGSKKRLFIIVFIGLLLLLLVLF